MLLAGDSLLSQAASRLRHDLAGHGDEATVRAIPGSGLLAVNFDWLGELGRLARRHHPEVAVLEFAGNYVPPLRRGELVDARRLECVLEGQLAHGASW